MTQNKIRTILDDVWSKGVYFGCQGKEKDDDKCIDEALSQLRSAMKEIVGEEELIQGDTINQVIITEINKFKRQINQALDKEMGVGK